MLPNDTLAEFQSVIALHKHLKRNCYLVHPTSALANAFEHLLKPQRRSKASKGVQKHSSLNASEENHPKTFKSVQRPLNASEARSKAPKDIQKRSETF